MDRFSFFFAFYGLMLGLGIAELLTGFASMVRAHALKRLEAQTALTALFIFVLVVATWVDTFTMSQSITLNFYDLLAPVLLSTFYYLAAAVVFPRDPRQYSHLRAYFAARRQFIIGMLFAAELCDVWMNLPFFREALAQHPDYFWGWLLPFNVLFKLVFLALLLTRGRRITITLLAVQIVLLLAPYWHSRDGAVQTFTMHLLGY